MHYFYVLYSLKDGNLYKGATQDVLKRLVKHNQGGNKSTKHRRPLLLIYFKEFEHKSEALAYERESKTLEGGVRLRKILVDLGILNSNGALAIQG